MRIVNLIENTQGHEGCVPEHGLSFYVETERHRLLVDSGPSDNTWENAKTLGIDLKSIDTLILSHGHYDHSGGIGSFFRLNDKAKVYMQMTATNEYYAYDGKEEGYRYIGIDKCITGSDRVVYAEGDMRLDDELEIFVINHKICPVPSSNRTLMIKSRDGYLRDDFRHEQMLSVISGEKRILIGGCAHNGILNITECYRRRYGTDPDLVISGFHLMKKTEYTQDEIAEIKDIAVRLKEYDTRFITCHCTGKPAYELMKEIMGDRLSYIHTGETIDL